MTLDQGIKVAEILLPIILTIMGAKIVNANTPHWTKWKGIIGKLVGLLVEICDQFSIEWRDSDDRTNCQEQDKQGGEAGGQVEDPPQDRSEVGPAS